MLLCCSVYEMSSFLAGSSYALRDCWFVSVLRSSTNLYCLQNTAFQLLNRCNARIFPLFSHSTFTFGWKNFSTLKSSQFALSTITRRTQQLALPNYTCLPVFALQYAPQLQSGSNITLSGGKLYKKTDLLLNLLFTDSFWQDSALQKSWFFSPLIIFFALAGSFGFSNGKQLYKPCLADTGSSTMLSAPVPSNDAVPTVQAGIFIEGLPSYTPEQVANHNSAESRIWVTYKQGVYDITEFIQFHPGGSSRISLAAGASIDPFWALYAQHHTNEVYELLEEMRIGNLIEDSSKPVVAPDDPFKNEPRRHPALHVVSLKPFNAETPLQILCDNFITPNALFFVRNHLPVPEVNANTYRLSIKGLGMKTEISLTLDEIRSLFKKHSVTATIQCAGNRRDSFGKIRPVKGLNWSTGAISTAVWSGALLKDVLAFCGISAQSVENLDIEHVHFEGLDSDMENQNYGASIPISNVMSKEGEIILAYEMNGEPLPLDHGFPLRVVAPGIVGARDVKWLKTIVMSSDESPSFWQQHDYRSFSPSIDWSTVDWRRAPSIQEYPVQSGICFPADGACIPSDEDTFHVKGYAWSGGGRAIIRVEISLDEGKTWHEAKLCTKDPRMAQGDEESLKGYEEVIDWGKRRVDKAWAWALWDVEVPISDALRGITIKVHCRAVDASYNTQPESAASVWNLRGCLCNCWHSVSVVFAKKN